MIDPTEAPQSNWILPAIEKWFPNADIMRTVGIVYHCALDGLLHTFNEDQSKRDRDLLELLLKLDQHSLSRPDLDCHYATALAIKD